MRNLPICLRSAGVLFVFGIVYHPKKNNRLKRLKMKNKKIAPDFTTKSDFSFAHNVDETQTQGKKRHKDNKINKNRRKLCIFHFFDYLCENV